MNVPEARFCEACGKPMDTSAPEKLSALDAQERRRVNRELGRAFAVIKRVRLVFIACAVLAAVALLISAIAYSEFDDEQLLLLVIPAAVCVFFVLGAIFLVRAPFVWALSLSCLLTLEVILTFAMGSFPGVLLILMTLGSWGATASVVNVKKLLRQHPDLVGAQRILGTRQRAPESATTARLREKKRETRQKVAVFAGLVLVLIVVISFVVGLTGGSNGSQGTAHASTAPKSPDYRPYVATFEKAWNAGNRQGIVELFDPDVRDWQLKRLARRLEQHAIDATFPTLTDYNVILIPRNNPQKVKAYWSIPTSRLRTEWHHEAGKWVLVRLSFQRPR